MQRSPVCTPPDIADTAERRDQAQDDRGEEHPGQEPGGHKTRTWRTQDENLEDPGRVPERTWRSTRTYNRWEWECYIDDENGTVDDHRTQGIGNTKAPGTKRGGGRGRRTEACNNNGDQEGRGI